MDDSFIDYLTVHSSETDMACSCAPLGWQLMLAYVGTRLACRAHSVRADAFAGGDWKGATKILSQLYEMK